MIDTVTFGATQYDPGGPIIRPEEPPILIHDEHPSEPPSRGQLIGGVLALVLMIACGIYLLSVG